MAHILIKNPTPAQELLAMVLGEIGFAQDTREQMRLDEERRFIAHAEGLAEFAGILEGDNDDIENFLFGDEQ